MQFQRARRLNQQPLHLVLPIKEPVAENAEKLLQLLQAGAPVVEEALDKRKHVHSAYFMLVENDTHLSMMTVYDGDFDAYVEHFAIDVPLFDEQLKYLKDAPPLPTPGIRSSSSNGSDSTTGRPSAATSTAPIRR